MAGRDGYILSHDPEARITTRAYDMEGVAKVNTLLGDQNVGGYPQHGGEVVAQVTTQDCGPIMDMAKMLRDHGSWRRPGSGPKGMHHVAFIPQFMIPHLNRMGILNDQKRLREFLDSPEMAYLRTDPRPLSPRGMKRKYGGR
ncbi:hypothetical protein [Candidatus Poriferisocius sp.]|uniref:hypothetical protein n=1 Tax=Candidatus Poriferisocius sp. TaxID=3101276 RepID=UPI003B526EA1